MDYLDASTFNDIFITKLSSLDGQEKAAAAGGAFVREKLREVSFARKILPAENVTKADCQRSVNHDTLVKIMDVEPKSQAMALNFRGKPSNRYIMAPRYELPFFKVSSEKFVKEEAELLAYNFPVTKIIEDNSVKDIQYVEDSKFKGYSDSAVNITGKKVETAAGITRVDRQNLTSLIKMIDADELPVGTVLMHKASYDDFLVQDGNAIGTDLAGEITVNGYKYNTILGHKLVVSIKTSILAPNEIYVYSDPKYLGNFFVLNDTKFYIEKRASLISWQSWEYIAMGFGNIRGIGKLVITEAEDIPGVWDNPATT